MGRNLYRIYGKGAAEAAEKEAEAIEKRCQAEIRASEEKLAQIDGELETVKSELKEQLEKEGRAPSSVSFFPV
jgi:hypothetical protein